MHFDNTVCKHKEPEQPPLNGCKNKNKTETLLDKLASASSSLYR